MIRAEERINNLIDYCYQWRNYELRSLVEIYAFPINENRDHLEFHIMTIEPDFKMVDGILEKQNRWYSVHLYPDRDYVQCRITRWTMDDMTEYYEKLREMFPTQGLPKRERNKAIKAKLKYAKEDKSMRHKIKMYDDTYDVLDRPSEGYEDVLPEHILIVCRRRGIYFDYGTI